MDKLAMEYGALTSALADVRRVHDELERGRTTLHRSFGDFLGGGWTGRAADSFRGGWSDWSTGTGEMLSALDSLADAMEETRRGLEGHDGHIHGRMNSVQAALGGTSEGPR